MENLSAKQLENTLLLFIRENKLSDFSFCLNQIPSETEFELKPGFITFNIYKCEADLFEVTTTLGGLTAKMSISQITSFFFNKTTSVDYDWN